MVHRDTMPSSTRRRKILVSGAAVVAAGVVGGILESPGAAARLLPGNGPGEPLPAVPLARRVVFGAYAADEPWPTLARHYALERKVGRLPTMSWFQDWGTGWLATAAASAQSTGHNILIAWDPSISGQPLSFADIAAGRYDQYLTKYFRGARS